MAKADRLYLVPYSYEYKDNNSYGDTEWLLV